MSFPSMNRHHALSFVAAALLPASASADTLTERWSLLPDDTRTYLSSGNNERGIALNPVTGNLLLLSRAGGPAVYVLDPRDGSDGTDTLGAPRVLRLDDDNGDSPVTGGTFTLNLVGAANDGAVFACNLATSLGTVRIYRWADDDPNTPISVAYSGDPLEGITDPGTGQSIRFGDNFAVTGSGTDTRLLQTARDGKYVILYSTTDGFTFTPRVFPSPALSGKAGLGLAFDAGNVFWAKAPGTELQRAELDLATDAVRVLGPVATTVVAGTVSGIGVDPVAKRLAAVDYGAHTLRVFDITDPAGFIQIGDPLAFPTLPNANANGNGTGAAAVRGTNVFGLDTNNGLLAAQIEPSVVVDPPLISVQPPDVTLYAGADLNLAVSVQGTPPFTYQWFYNDAFLANATSAQLSIPAITPEQSGSYYVAITNAAGFVVSEPALVTVKAPLNRGILQPLWSLNPGDRPYLTTDNTQRGLAYNPATGNLLVASRSPANSIVVLDAATGAEKHALRTTAEDDSPLFVGGTLTLNMIAVADDGVVYAANLVTDNSSGSFKLYRWDHDGPDAIPTALESVPELALPERWGDTIDIRGSGPNAQILLGARGPSGQEGQKFAVLTSPDGFTFNAQIFYVDGVAPSAFGLGIAFGPGNTVFGTANGQPVVHAAFDPSDGTATLARTYPTDVLPAAVSFLAAQASSNLLAGVALETPDNVVLYDVASPDAPALIDQRLILPEQPNANGTGSVDFGADRLFVLDTNHGLRAYAIDRSSSGEPPVISVSRNGSAVSVSWSNGSLESALQITGPWTDSPGTSPQTFSDGQQRFFRARR